MARGYKTPLHGDRPTHHVVKDTWPKSVGHPQHLPTFQLSAKLGQINNHKMCTSNAKAHIKINTKRIFKKYIFTYVYVLKIKN